MKTFAEKVALSLLPRLPRRKKCPNCGAELEEHEVVCYACGADVVIPCGCT